jgi:virulence-associated protein VapD
LDLDSLTTPEIFRITSNDRIRNNLKKHGFCYDESKIYWNRNKISSLDIIIFLKKFEGVSVSGKNAISIIKSYDRTEKLEYLLTNKEKNI